MEIAKKMFEGVVEPSSKKTTREYYNHSSCTKQMRGEDASSKIHCEMVKRAGKFKKRYVDHLMVVSTLICIIHNSGNY